MDFIVLRPALGKQATLQGIEGQQSIRERGQKSNGKKVSGDGHNGVQQNANGMALESGSLVDSPAARKNERFLHGLRPIARG
jgi:hypothetical protein